MEDQQLIILLAVTLLNLTEMIMIKKRMIDKLTLNFIVFKYIIIPDHANEVFHSFHLRLP